MLSDKLQEKFANLTFKPSPRVQRPETSSNTRPSVAGAPGGEKPGPKVLGEDHRPSRASSQAFDDFLNGAEDHLGEPAPLPGTTPFRTVVRCRPASKPGEMSCGFGAEGTGPDKVLVRVSFPEPNSASREIAEQIRRLRSTGPRSFRCNAFLGPEAGQQRVFEEVTPLVDWTLLGNNSTVFCYGATGSGKSHTIVGSSEDAGLIERLAQKTFSIINERLSTAGDVYILEGSYLEIYVDGGREQLFDLLCDDERKLEIKQDPLNLQAHVCEGLRRVPIRSAEEMCKVLHNGQRRCTVLATARNISTARSHRLFTLTVESLVVKAGMSEHMVQRGKITVVEMAGSECLNLLDQGSGQGMGMPRFMACLDSAMVSNGGGEGQSSLVMLMRDCMGSPSRALFLTTIAPEMSQVEESLKSMTFMQQLHAPGAKKLAAGSPSAADVAAPPVQPMSRAMTDDSMNMSGSLKQMRQRHNECIQALHDQAADAQAYDAEHRRRLQEEVQDLGKRLMSKAAAEKTLEEIRAEQGRLFNEVRKEMSQAMGKELEKLRLQSQTDLDGLRDSVEQKVSSLDSSRHRVYTEEHSNRINEMQGELREAVRLQRAAEDETGRLREKLAAAEERARMLQARQEELRKERGGLDEERRRLRQQAESQWARLSAAEGELQRCKAEADVQRAELTRLTDLRNEDIEALRRDREAWRQREAELQKEIADLQRRMDEARREADLRAVREEAEKREALSQLRLQVERLEGEAKARAEQITQAEEARASLEAELDTAQRREESLRRQGAEELRRVREELEEAKNREAELMHMLNEVQDSIIMASAGSGTLPEEA